MAMSNVFQLDSTHQFFHWKDTTSLSLICWKQILSNCLKALNPELANCNTSFFPLCTPTAVAPSVSFAISLRPFTDKIILPNSLHIISSSKIFRQVCSSLSVFPPHLASIEFSILNFFWSLSLTMIQRNAIYQFLHDCILPPGSLASHVSYYSLILLVCCFFICNRPCGSLLYLLPKQGSRLAKYHL